MIKGMDLNGMVVFAQVVERSSFTGAARALGLPKQSVSRKIAELEESLGVRLLERSTRRLRLTERGAVFYEHARRVVEEANEAARAMQASHGEPQGVLRVTAPALFANAFLGEVVNDYLRRYPAARLEMFLSDQREDLIGEGFDVAIRVGALEDSTLVARRLGMTQGVCCATPGLLASAGTPRTPQELADSPCIVYGPERNTVRWRLYRGQETQEVTLAPRLHVNSAALALGAALEGLGITRLPTFLCADALRDGRLVRVLDDWCLEMGPIHAVFVSRRHMTPDVRAFLTLLEEHFGDHHPWEPLPRQPCDPPD